MEKWKILTMIKFIKFVVLKIKIKLKFLFIPGFNVEDLLIISGMLKFPFEMSHLSICSGLVALGIFFAEAITKAVFGGTGGFSFTVFNSSEVTL